MPIQKKTKTRKRIENPRKPGRPSKLTPERQAKIVEALEAGNTLEAAAGCGGIDYDTLMNWMKRGRRYTPNGPDKEFFEFFSAVKDAEAEAINYHVRKIHADEGWQSSAWFLERRRSDDYRKRESKEISGPEGGPIPLKWADE